MTSGNHASHLEVAAEKRQDAPHFGLGGLVPLHSIEKVPVSHILGKSVCSIS